MGNRAENAEVITSSSPTLYFGKLGYNRRKCQAHRIFAAPADEGKARRILFILTIPAALYTRSHASPPKEERQPEGQSEKEGEGRRKRNLADGHPHQRDRDYSEGCEVRPAFQVIRG
jgi:hypothetical protein